MYIVHLHCTFTLYAKFGLKKTVFHVLIPHLFPLLTKVMSLILAKLNDFMLCSTIMPEF